MASEKDCTPAQLALAWTMARAEDIIPIPGTKEQRYLEENLGALHLSLTEEELRRLDEAFPLGVAAGERYSAQGMKTLNH